MVVVGLLILQCLGTPLSSSSPAAIKFLRRPAVHWHDGTGLCVGPQCTGMTAQVSSSYRHCAAELNRLLPPLRVCLLSVSGRLPGDRFVTTSPAGIDQSRDCKYGYGLETARLIEDRCPTWCFASAQRVETAACPFWAQFRPVTIGLYARKQTQA
jgi:hypothetical protein